MENSRLKIYGNNIITDTLTSMIKSERLSHAFLIYGKNGLGKKTIAKYIAMQILCNEHTGTPCFNCKSCRMIMDNQHPDVQWITHTDASKGFSVSSLRELSLDAYVLPNEGEKKIYIFADCDNMLPASQNTLLKLIEEPPQHTVFIFTASSKDNFLPTIISRVISLGVTEVSESQCRQALAEKGITDIKSTDDAITAFRGNIGMCLEYISGEELPLAVKTARCITDDMASGSEYSLLKTIYTLDSKKERTKSVIYLLSDIIRDSCVIKTGSNILTGCYPSGSEKLVKTFSQRQLRQIYDLLVNTNTKIDGYANLSLTLTSLCSQIKDILN